MRHLAAAIGLTTYHLGRVADDAAYPDRPEDERLWGIALWARRTARPSFSRRKA
ncbi:hypothetical protein ACIBEJ_24735 [Nonomuraea sp. NPDC050790]|uniref:hypothetical protein n=1 Tax=Nonomuraea sp. NPDC050790 TaxID=3364371 RepID=UPI00379CA51E